MTGRFRHSWMRLALSLLLASALAACAGDMHGSAGGSGDDRAAAGHIRLGLPF